MMFENSSIGPKGVELVAATTNQGKLAEVMQLLADKGVTVRGLSDFSPPPPPAEEGRTLSQNARLKALYYSRLLGPTVLADDSGLIVNALQGRPGVHSARFAECRAAYPAERDLANNRKLLELLADVPWDKRQARFCCCLCLARAGRILLEVEGILEGYIAREPHGENGFGYDPVFWLPGEGKTVAELTVPGKNAISHRGQALRTLLKQWDRINFNPI